MSDVKIKSFRDLQVWQLGLELAKDIYHLTENFPKHELYGLTLQIRRSAISIPSNIAEGYSRSGIADYTNFISISIGSLAELETQLIIANDIGLISLDNLARITTKIHSLQRMLHGLRKSLQAKQNGKPPNA